MRCRTRVGCCVCPCMLWGIALLIYVALVSSDILVPLAVVAVSAVCCLGTDLVIGCSGIREMSAPVSILNGIVPCSWDTNICAKRRFMVACSTPSTKNASGICVEFVGEGVGGFVAGVHAMCSRGGRYAAATWPRPPHIWHVGARLCV